MTFKNSQWAVTKYGLEVLKPEPPYEIKASRLTETTTRNDGTFYDWPVHVAEKEWVDLGAFAEAFRQALEFHKGSYSPEVNSEMLEASFTKASRIANER